jgi:hypothetical protein
MATVSQMAVAALIVAGVLGWDDRRSDSTPGGKRQPTDLVDWLMPYQRGPMADEAQRWLDQQS